MTPTDLIQRLIEAPVDTGGYPDFIHPSRRQQLRTGRHPYGAHPGVDSGGAPDNTPEKLASRRYQTMMGRLQQGGALSNNPGQVMQSVATALRQAIQAEAPHKAELERLAVETVLSLPEFESAAQAYKAGAFKIDAKLTGGQNPDLGAGRATPDEEDPDAPQPEAEDDAEIDYAEIDDEKRKRKLVNALIHGAAVNNDYSFQLAKSDLDRMSPTLAPAYSKIMAGTQLGYWMVPDETIKQLAAQGGTMGGSSVGMAKLDQEDSKPVVRARGIVFPVLIHELVKGLTELVSYGGLPKAGAMKKAVLKGDTLDAETWDLLLGPEVWRNLSDSVEVKDRRLLMNVYDVLVKLPPDKFHMVTKELSAGGDRAKAVTARLMRAVKDKRKFESSKLTLEFLPSPKFAGPKVAPDIETDPDIEEFPGVDDPDADEEDLPGQDPWRREITPGQEPEPKARRHATSRD